MSGRRFIDVLEQATKRALRRKENKGEHFVDEVRSRNRLAGVLQQYESFLADSRYDRRQYKYSKRHNTCRLGDIETSAKDVQVKHWEDYLDLAKRSYEERLARNQSSSDVVKRQDFEFIRTLGSGAFARVMLVRHISNKNFYAAKLMMKSLLVRDKHVNHALNEKQILQGIRFPFTIHMEFFFQDNVYIFFVLPLISGGELFTYLTRVSRFKEEVAKLYCAQICLALEYLHYIGLIFRDLKPENILIDNKGFLKLADFGFCKAIKDRTYTFCGTTEYLAPEMINCKGYGTSVDWWTFGIFAYELCAGYTPFYSKFAAKTYDNISKCKYKMPFFFSNDLRDLVKNILQVDLSRRFGTLKNGVNDIKEHKWFREIPWTMLVNRQIRPPYVPVITRPDDTRHFEPQSEEPLDDSPYDMYAGEFANF